MTISALFLGSIGVLAETSDIQREAYNRALKEAGGSWHWDPSTYRDLLTQSGGRNRLRQLSATTGAPLSEDAIVGIHRRKTELACQAIIDRKVPLRPGVEALIRHCLDCGIALGLVTTTYRENIDAIAEAAGAALPLSAFACVLTNADVTRGKPAPDIYLEALARTKARAEDALAIEDTTNSLLSAKAAGIAVVATPGAFTDSQDFRQADLCVPTLADETGGIREEIVSMLTRP